MTAVADEPDIQPASVPLPPPPEHHHRNVRGGAARAAVFGVSDGLVTNVALILGVAGGDAHASVVRLAGLAGLIAGSASMAVGEYNSMRVQAELLERELAMERVELRRNPNVETAELAQLYQSRGVDPDHARSMAEEMMADPDRALDTHAREELGIDPAELGSPIASAIASFVSFATGAFVPLVPWLFGGGTAATIVSIVLAAAAALVVGAVVSRFTERSAWLTAGRQLGQMVVAAGVTFLIGKAIGTSVT